jgi:Protein of unknown function (DUF3105)
MIAGSWLTSGPVASRQEEKERRRAERLAEEEKARAAAQRARRLQMVGGAVLVAAVVVVAAVLISSSGGSDKSPSAKAGNSGVAIPAAGPLAKGDKVDQAARAAGCTAKTFPVEGRSHVTSTVNYKTNPPTSGNHNPTPAEDGIYDPGNTPAKENFVHALEHGRIEIQYRPGTPKRARDQLETLFNEKVNGTEGYHTLLFQNNTNMPYAVAATAWTHLLGCPKMNDKVFDAIRAFRLAYTDKGPEFIP